MSRLKSLYIPILTKEATPQMNDIFTYLRNTINGDIEVGNPTNGAENLYVDFETHTVATSAGEAFEIDHNLNRECYGYWYYATASGTVWTTNSTPGNGSTTKVYLKTDIASGSTIQFIFW